MESDPHHSRWSIRQDDVYTDENGVNYTVSKARRHQGSQVVALHEEAAIVVINDRNTLE